jgi:hypothetical protein
MEKKVAPGVLSHRNLAGEQRGCRTDAARTSVTAHRGPRPAVVDLPTQPKPNNWPGLQVILRLAGPRRGKGGAPHPGGRRSGRSRQPASEGFAALPNFIEKLVVKA